MYYKNERYINTLTCTFTSLDLFDLALLQELNLRAQGEVIIRDALRELDMWGAGAVFQLTEYEDSHKAKVMLIKEWKELVTQVGIVCCQIVFCVVCRNIHSNWVSNHSVYLLCHVPWASELQCHHHHRNYHKESIA